MDPGRVAHLQQQRQTLSNQIEVAEATLGEEKNTQHSTVTLENQIQAYKDELAAIEAEMQEAGVPEDPAETERRSQKDMAKEGASKRGIRPLAFHLVRTGGTGGRRAARLAFHAAVRLFDEGDNPRLKASG